MKGNCKTTLPVTLLLILILEREVVESRVKGNCKETLPVVLLLILILEREVVESER